MSSNATLGRLSVEVTQAIYDNTHFTEEYMATVANLGTTEQIAELMFGGNTEAAVKFKEKYSYRSFNYILVKNYIDFILLKFYIYCIRL